MTDTLVGTRPPRPEDAPVGPGCLSRHLRSLRFPSVLLSDSTRRRIGLALWLALGVLPAVGLAAWGLWWRSGWHVQSEARALSWQLGLKASLAAVRHPKPGVVVYEGLHLREPEANQPVFRCRAVEARWWRAANNAGSSRPVLQLDVVQPEVNASQWREVVRLVEWAIGRRLGLLDIDLRLAAPELTWVAGSQSQRLVALEAKIEALAERTEAELVFRLAEQPTAEPARLALTRNRQITPLATALELQTQGTVVPGAWLALGLEELAGLGPHARFRGRLWMVHSPEGSHGELAGRFDQVDLDRLVKEQGPYQLTGTAELTIDTARFSANHLREASGVVQAGPGLVSRSLLEAAVEQFGLATGPGVDPADQLLRYDRLAMAFVWNAQGFQVRGSPSAQGGTILSGRRGAMLCEAQRPRQVKVLEGIARDSTAPSDGLIPLARQHRRLAPPPAHPEPNPPVDSANPLRP